MKADALPPRASLELRGARLPEGPGVSLHRRGQRGRVAALPMPAQPPHGKSFGAFRQLERLVAEQLPASQ
jgi:hypothetical protein